MNYSSLQKYISNFKKNANLSVKVIGKSVLSKNIYAVLSEQDVNYPWAIITAGIHAREHLSTDLLVRLIKDFANQNGKYKYNIAFVPLVNPDGANLVLNNLQGVAKDKKEKLLKINGSEDFSLFKANANGVDLNNNFNANWNIKYTTKKQPSSQGYYGIKPHSEPETQALANFTISLNPFLTISYHLKGEEIYFDFFQNTKNYIRDYKIAKVFASSTGYKIKSTQTISSGGYKDWCVQKLNIPSLTIELGENKFMHPYPQSETENIYNKNKGVFDCISQALTIYTMENHYGIHATSSKTCKKGL